MDYVAIVLFGVLVGASVMVKIEKEIRSQRPKKQAL